MKNKLNCIKKPDKYICMSVIVLIYMIIINNTQNSILSLGLLLMSVVFIFEPIYILPNIFVSSMFGEYFIAFNGMGVSRFFTIIFILGSLLKCIKGEIKLNRKFVFFILLFNVFNLLSCVFSITGSIVPFLTMALNTMILFFVYHCEYKELNKIIKLFSISLIIMIGYISLSVLLGEASTESGRLVFDQATNANNLGMALAQIIAFFSAMIILDNNSHKNVMYIIFMLVGFFNLILTGSRTALLAAVLGIVTSMTIHLFYKKRIKKNMLILIVSGAVLVGIYFMLSESGLEIMERYSAESVLESGGTGRVDIWKILINYVIPKNLLFGVGFGGQNVMYAVSEYTSTPHGTHNMILTIIAQTGIIGSIIYFTFFIKSIYEIVRRYKFNNYLIIPISLIVTAFFNGIGEEIFSERFLWTAIGLGFFIIKNRNEIKNTKLANKNKG